EEPDPAFVTGPVRRLRPERSEPARRFNLTLAGARAPGHGQEIVLTGGASLGAVAQEAADHAHDRPRDNPSRCATDATRVPKRCSRSPYVPAANSSTNKLSCP